MEGSTATWPSPVVVTTENGYTYDATSDWWKEQCWHLPSFELLHWPGYLTALYPVTIGKTDVFIQCWKGYCQRFLDIPTRDGTIQWPGGVGAEVGIYRRNERQKTVVPTMPSEWPTESRAAGDSIIATQLAMDTTESWYDRYWPADDVAKSMGEDVTFTVWDPRFTTPLIADYGTPTYWTCKWMEVDDYNRWCVDRRAEEGIAPEQFEIPTMPDARRLKLDFTVAGTTYVWNDDTGIHPKQGARRA